MLMALSSKSLAVLFVRNRELIELSSCSTVVDGERVTKPRKIALYSRHILPAM
jgi:hypothetical protein